MSKALFHIVLGVFAVYSTVALGQTTSLSGTQSNPTTAVTATTINTADVTSTSGLNVDDTVLIIQMKGAVIDETNTASFGTINDIDDAGNYEFAIICSISGLTITFQADLTNSYDPTNGYVQLMRVPTYTDVTVDGAISAPAWDVQSGTGGILVVWASGTVTLNADIDMDEAGFAGGWEQNDYSACTCGCSFSGDPEYTDYYFPSGSCRGASKGEGVADSIPGKEFGRGPEASGGGGGNDHNTGGGGGANYGAGGLGGTATTPSCFFGEYCRGNYPGIGGVSLSSYYGGSKIFLGGGGGAGHSNNPLDTRGKAGGGIIIIVANTLDGGGQTISARGGSVTALNDGDGAGAGGAGGTILLNVNTITATAFTVDASGGDGGDLTATTATNCKGPGGGGGGGVIWSQAALPGTVTTDVSGGANGAQLAGSCVGQTMGATSGGAGATLTGLAITVGGTPCTVLPVELIGPTAVCSDRTVTVTWKTLSEIDNDFFEVEFASEGVHFQTLGVVNGTGTTLFKTEYQFQFELSLRDEGYVRLKQVDKNGDFSYSEMVHLSCQQENYDVRVVNGHLLVSPPSGPLDCQLYDVTGRLLFSGLSTQIDFNQMAETVFYLRIFTKSGVSDHRLVYMK